MKNKILSKEINIPTRKIEGDKYFDKFSKYLDSLEDLIILSPHLDDAILSVGSLISSYANKVKKIRIISIFTEGSNLKSLATETLLSNANQTDAYKYFSIRRREDKEAIRLLGKIDIQHLGYTDSAWRVDAAGNPLYFDSQLMSLMKEDEKLQSEIQTKLKSIIKPKRSTGIFAPIARGNHADHQIIRNAAIRLFPNVIFYEDFPYSTLYVTEGEFIRKNKLKEIIWVGDYEKKKEAILKYESQTYALFYSGPISLPYEKYFVNFSEYKFNL